MSQFVTQAQPRLLCCRVEQPEDFPTCLATQPARKSEVAHHFKKLKLCKGA